jgi:hypothetical protein
MDYNDKIDLIIDNVFTLEYNVRVSEAIELIEGNKLELQEYINNSCYATCNKRIEII